MRGDWIVYLVYFLKENKTVAIIIVLITVFSLTFFLDLFDNQIKLFFACTSCMKINTYFLQGIKNIKFRAEHFGK